MARSDFSKHLLILISGTTIAQLISIGISPILSRIYSLEEFGMFASFSALVGLVSLLVGARYEGAILLPKKDDDAANLLVLALFFNFVISAFFLVVVYIYSFFTTGNHQIRFLEWYYLAPVFTMFTGFAQSINNWFNRRKNYTKIVQYRVFNSTLNSGASLTFAPLELNGLILSLILSAVFSISIFFNKLNKDFHVFKSLVSVGRMKELAIEYKRFPLTNSIQALSDALQIYGIVYFIDYFFGKVILGVYSFSMRVLQVPMNFIGGALSQVFYQQASDTYNVGGDLQLLIRSTIKKSVVIAIPILLILLFLGPQIFAFVFGENFYEAGVYAQILAPWILLDFVRAPISQIPIIIGYQNKLLFISMVNNLIIICTMLYAGIFIKDIKTGLFILSVFQSTYILLIIAWFYRISKLKSIKSH